MIYAQPSYNLEFWKVRSKIMGQNHEKLKKWIIKPQIENLQTIGK